MLAPTSHSVKQVVRLPPMLWVVWQFCVELAPIVRLGLFKGTILQVL